MCSLVDWVLTCTLPPSTGDSIVLALTPSLSRSAFVDSNLPRGIDATGPQGKKTFHDDLKETAHEKMLRERKSALNRLFDKTNLQPVVVAEAVKTASGKGKGKGKDAAGGTQSKRSMLERYDASSAMKKKDSDQGDEDGEEMSAMQLNMVCE